MLFKFGLPPEVNRGGVGFLVLAQTDPIEAAKAERYDRMGRMAIGLLIAGFVLQFIGTLGGQLRYECVGY